MQMRKLGTTDINVSLLCLGTMTFGEQNSEAEGHAQMDYAASQGINFFDTAELYAVPPSAATYGKTEEIIGTWFEKTKKRKEIVLATKVAGPAAHLSWIRNGKACLEPSQILAAAEGSLKRLKTDYIDLYQIHWPERPVNSFRKLGFDEPSVSGQESDHILSTLETLETLVKSGKVRYIGLSNETPWGVMTYLKHHAVKNLPRIVSIQNPYNLLNRSFEVGLAEMAMQEKVGLLAYSPLGGGSLSGKYVNGQVPKGSRWDIDPRGSRYKGSHAEQAIKAYLNIAQKHGINPVQMALAFVNRQAFLTSNIIGATSLEQLKVNIDSVNITLSLEVISEINAIHAVFSNPCP